MSLSLKNNSLRLGIAGLGTIGLDVAKRVNDGAVQNMHVAAVSGRDKAKAEGNIAGFSPIPKIVEIDELASHCDVIVECAPKPLFPALASSAVEAGCIFIPLSVGALLENMDLVERANKTGARIMVPTGALIGLDAVKAASVSEVHSIKITTRKPPAGLRGAPHIVNNEIDIEHLEGALKVFSGSAREAAIGFPNNVNVAAALALAGIGPERTQVEVWADPGVSRNIHSIDVKAEASNFSMSIENVPSEENPPTGKITSLSTLAMLKRLTDPLVVGT
ncbi:MAG: aspartate dehydrogenase [Hyphomicrobiales bacterium]